MLNHIGQSFTGHINFQLWDGATLSPRSEGPLNLVDFSVAAKSTIIPRYANLISGDAVVLDSISKREPSTFKGTINGLSSRLLSILMLGTDSAYTQASGNFTAFEIDDIVRDVWYQLPYHNVNPADIVITVGVATYDIADIDVDWSFDATGDRIMILSTGAIAEAADISVAGSQDGVTGTQIAVGTVSKYPISIKGWIQSRVDPTYKRFLHVPKASLVADGDVPFVNGPEYASLTFTGSPELIDGYSSDILMLESVVKAAH
ncbi:hypothetical protein [Caudoviricetes sp.]|nr:hypothetical protein [Caudoviricetes sp.]